MLKKKKSFLYADKNVVSQKIKEAFSSVLPISLIVIILALSVAPVENGIMLSFLFGVFFTVTGMGLFTLGADKAMTPIGEYVGTNVVKSKKLWIIIPVFFLMGVLITVSEPDLQVLAGQLKETIDSTVLVFTVGAGVGFFLVVAFLRIVFRIKLKYLLVALYAALFVLTLFVPENFIPLAFDSGGVTTGPMSVPFIISIGTGIAALRSDDSAEEDGFGLTALCSVGPIIAVMILGIIYKPDNFTVTENVFPQAGDSKEIALSFLSNFPEYFKEVAVALLPIMGLYAAVRLFGNKVGKADTIKVLAGCVYTYVGLVTFLVGVNAGFLPLGYYLGEKIGNLSYNWIAVPIGMVLGYFVVAAEPAVHVLTVQVYEITAGAVPKKALSRALMIGVAISVGLAMLRILLHIPIMYFLVPVYFIALALAFVVPDIFTAIAFDSGGVASGAMATGFILPLALGVCKAIGGNAATEGFGVVAFVAMTPLITIQLLGLVYKKKTLALKKKTDGNAAEKEEIIE